MNAAPSGSGISARETTALVFAALCEAALLYVAQLQDMPKLALVFVHLAIVSLVALIIFVFRGNREGRAYGTIIVLAVAVAGAAGAVGMLAARLLLRTSKPGDAIVAAWYERLAAAGASSAATTICDQVTSGRELRAPSGPTKDFADVIARGTIAEKQTALGLIARNFHLDFLPVLDVALRAEEPVVRVQAAAVAARVRNDVKKRAAMLLQSGSSSSRQADLTHAGDMAALARSGILDARQTSDLAAAGGDRLRELLATPDKMRRQVLCAAPQTSAEVERYLLNSKRYADFRRWRKFSRLSKRGRYRVRFLATRTAAC